MTPVFQSGSKHIPVMLTEAIEGLAPHEGGVYVDGTFGQGGYSQALLSAADCRVWGIDRDPDAVKIGRDLEKKWPHRFGMIEGRFSDMVELLESRAVRRVDGVVLDLGTPSPQLDETERGFSFRTDGPLDMRMEKKGPTAADLVNSLPEEDLANVIYEFGEERYSRRVARKIVEIRKSTPFTRTLQLADVVRSVVPRERPGFDPATRTFQALRIKVNDELEELDCGLCAAEILLKPQGRLAVVSFHSLEDGRVKKFLKERSGLEPQGNRHAPFSNAPSQRPTFNLIARKALKPSETEASANPRARSAKLRVAERTEAPVRYGEGAGL